MHPNGRSSRFVSCPCQTLFPEDHGLSWPGGKAESLVQTDQASIGIYASLNICCCVSCSGARCWDNHATMCFLPRLPTPLRIRLVLLLYSFLHGSASQVVDVQRISDEGHAVCLLKSFRARGLVYGCDCGLAFERVLLRSRVAWIGKAPLQPCSGAATVRVRTGQVPKRRWRRQRRVSHGAFAGPSVLP